MSLLDLIDEFDLPVKICKICDGEGRINVFCGHDCEETCPDCEGKGYVRKKTSTRRSNRKNRTD